MSDRDPNETVQDYLARRNAEHETEFHCVLFESDVVDLATGTVNANCLALFRACLDWHLEDERKAAANVAQVTYRERKARAKAGQSELALTRKRMYERI